ncbi:MAG TPA: kynureninase [Croceibacterium sp.]|nr:kynureninase [Croceibacterium sp.]
MTTLAECEARDAADPLARIRQRFALPDGVIYLDGNSLGALPRAAASHLARVVEAEWGEGLVRSWNTAGWYDAPRRVGAKIARLIGAHDDEVLVADSTSVNLYKLLRAVLSADSARHTILTEPGNFPTDLHIAQGIAAVDPRVRVQLAPREAIADAAGPGTIVLLTHVHYRTCDKYDMAAVNRAVKARGGIVVWDLSHSVGAVALDLAADGAELAVGCGYKYLSGGPGAPAFLYVARHLQARLHSPVTGWLGHAAPFAFADDYVAAPGIDRFQSGTPPILGLAALECGVDLMLETDMALLAAKGQALCDLFIEQVDARCPGLELVTPRDRRVRGSHVSYRHPHAYAVMQALIARGVIGDFREPAVIRFGFAPLYTGFADAWRAVEALAQVLATQAWDDPRFAERARVT